MSTITEASFDGYRDSPERLVTTTLQEQSSAGGRRPWEELEAENVHLKAENERLLEDRELLLTTVGIVVRM